MVTEKCLAEGVFLAKRRLFFEVVINLTSGKNIVARSLSAPLRLADHQGRYVLRFAPAVGVTGTASMVRIPGEIKGGDAQSLVGSF